MKTSLRASRFLRITAFVTLLLPGFAAAQESDLALVTAELGRHADDALLRAAARSEDASLRRRAAQVAGRLRLALSPDAAEGAEAARPPGEWLLSLLRDEDASVRRAALFAAGQIGGADILLPIRTILPELGVQDLPFALEALGKSADPRAASPLAAALSHGEALIRGEAALALFRLRDASVLPDLFAALAREQETEPRWQMTYACFRLLRERSRASGAPVEASPVWKELLSRSLPGDRPYEERVYACLALGEIAGAKGALLPLLADRDPRVVVAAVRGLARPWEREIAERVAALAEDPDPLLQEVALEHVLAGEKDAAPLLHALTAKFAGQPRLCTLAAAAAAATGTAPPLPERAAAWTAAEREVWNWRIGATPAAPLPEGAPATHEGRLAVAELCGEEGIPLERAVALLVPLLADSDFTVRATAIGSLAKRGAKSEIPALLTAARDAVGMANPDVRSEVAAALGTLEHYDPWLQDAASADADSSVRSAARAALTALKKPLPPLPPPSGYRLYGLDAPAIVAEAARLEGARVLLDTNRGRIEMVLLPHDAPAHCVNLARLVARGFYDNLTWHRVVADFVIQGGCPRGDGWGGPGYSLPDEINRARYVRGAVGMPKSLDDTGGCQIFITHLPTPHLDGRYTVFAQVVSGLDVVDRVRIGDRIHRALLVHAGEATPPISDPGR